MKNLNYLVLAYMSIWTGLFLYIIFIAGKQKILLKKINILEEILNKKEKA